MEHMNPLVTIIFPIYNNERYLSRCIQSVLDQTLKDIELILIDDGSNDSAPEIIDDFGRKDERVRVVHKENEGSAAGRNMGLDMARGKYVAFVESDDCVAKDMYEKLYNYAEQTHADLVKCGFYFCEGENKREFTSFYDLAAENETFEAKDRPNIFQYHASIWAGIYNADFLNRNRIRFLVTPKASYSDFSWRAETYAYAKRISILHCPLYNYTFDNPESSYKKIGTLFPYKIYHAMESNRILREAGIWDFVKEDLAVQSFNNCVDGARYAFPDQYEMCFEKLRELFIDLFDSSFEYKYFSNKNRYLINLVLNNEFEKFFDLLFYRYCFMDVEKFAGKNVVLFGAGKCGRSYQIQLKKYGINISKWIDNNPNDYLDVDTVESIDKENYDYVLLAILDESIADEMKKQLLSMGVSEEKIVWEYPMRLK